MGGVPIKKLSRSGSSLLRTPLCRPYAEGPTFDAALSTIAVYSQQRKARSFAMEIASVAVMAVLVGLTFGLIELCDRL